MSIFDHYRKEEHIFIEQALEWKGAVETFYEKKRTDFLDPREQEILASVIGKDDTVHLSFWGGDGECERKRALLYPFYEEISKEDFALSLFQLNYPAKFTVIKHRDILGSLIGLGIERRKFGDIMEKEGRFQFIAAAEISSFIEMNLHKVGNASVSVEPISFHRMLPISDVWEEAETTVSSFRLDALTAKMYHLSRSKALTYIEKGLVKVNWKTTEQPDFLLNSDDYVSIRGLGRRKVIETAGQTKKGRFKVTFGKKQDP
ncbi:RNA-binding protein [Bacillus piscicola]|uniref:YlmH family RNA-binding protein n=1 Tax=Bacillus piscicola TaxID=1632684 RepID=UPI001F098405|nr:RNA-binding protein [Bacillus piscicola]